MEATETELGQPLKLKRRGRSAGPGAIVAANPSGYRAFALFISRETTLRATSPILRLWWLLARFSQE